MWQKNLRLLVESLALVRDGLLRARRNPGPDGGPSFHMLFVGGGDAAKELEELVESHGLSQETRFLGVVRDREILRGLFERSDLFLFPSKYDTSALVIRESAAALCPTVFIEGSTVSEGVEDGVNGYLADDTPQSFAKRILAVLEDPEALKRTGTGAQRDFHRSWTTVAGEVMGQYREILARFGSEPARPVQKRSTMRAADATKRKAVRADQASKKKAEGSGRQRKRSGSIVPSSETSTPSDESSAS